MTISDSDLSSDFEDFPHLQVIVSALGVLYAVLSLTTNMVYGSTVNLGYDVLSVYAYHLCLLFVPSQLDFMY